MSAGIMDGSMSALLCMATAYGTLCFGIEISRRAAGLWLRAVEHGEMSNVTSGLT